MSQRIADAIGIVREVIESNHPGASVKSADPGESDFRVGSVGASVTVTEYGSESVTQQDIDDILDRAESELSGRHLEHQKDMSNADKTWFELHS